MRKVFEHRSNRVIASSRAALALLFALWIWIDPEQPVRGDKIGYFLMIAYVAWSAAQLPVSWSSWWYDFHLALPALLIDSAVFLTAIFFTEAQSSDFVSPYIAFFAFLTLSTAMRWNWRAALTAAVLLSIAYVLTGIVFRWLGLDVDLYKFLRRGSYMVALSLILTWFALERSGMKVARFVPAGVPSSLPPLADALAHAMRHAGATGGAIAWGNRDEPRIGLELAGSLGHGFQQVPRASLTLDAEPSAALFESEPCRSLALSPGERIEPHSHEGPAGLAAHLSVPAGLRVTIEGITGRGELLLTGIQSMSVDDLMLGKTLAREIARGLDDFALTTLAREAAVARTRADVARDLHDSVAQSLAGANFRLEALRNLIQSGADPLPELEAIKQSIRTEQGQLRTMIERLRREDASAEHRDIAGELSVLLDVLAQQWRIALRIDQADGRIVAPAWLVYEVQQLVREGVANAVRHGAATQMTIALGRDGDNLALTLADNGTGFAPAGDPVEPRSISERVRQIGGTLDLDSKPGDTRIRIALPIGGTD